MALVTVQRSPSPSDTSESSDLVDALVDSDNSLQRSKRSKSALKKLKRFINTVRFVTSLRFSESYLAVKGAAIILPQSECVAKTRQSPKSGDLASHLQKMFYLLRPQDTIQVAIKLESVYEEHNRYMVVVSTAGRQDTEESAILGVDCMDTATVGLVLPIWGGTQILLNGDGGFSVTSNECHKIFKPVSIQAMWSGLQGLMKVRDIACRYNYHPRGLTHTWVSYYEFRIKSAASSLAEWNIMDDIESHRPDSPLVEPTHTESDLEKLIKCKLKESMMTVDLEEVTSKVVRTALESEMKMDLTEYKHMIDQEMIFIMRQLDSSSKIFDHLYLGSEWNACNYQELKNNGVGYILNVTREIDNFFPGRFVYHNIRLYDVEDAELMKHWENTHKFITKAKEQNSKVLVHCKMGISRSASTVMAYAMKEFGWSLEEAKKYVKEKRGCVRPNAGFIQQLTTYEGILEANKNRQNFRQKSKSDDILNQVPKTRDGELGDFEPELVEIADRESLRPKSWSHAPDGSMAEMVNTAYNEYNNVPPIPLISTVPELPDHSGASAAAGPLQLAYDNWEEIDLSSRSADSLDELDDAASGASSMDDPVRLLSYKRFDGTLSEDEDMVCESDASELSDEVMSRRQRGFYDVRMLAGQRLFTDYSGGSSVPMDTSDLVHPDMKMELLLSQLKRQKQLWKLQNQQEIAAASVEEAKCYLSGKNLTSTPIPKVRADDSWIKDVPISPLPDLIMTTEQTDSNQDTKPTNTGAFLQVKPHDRLVRSSSQNMLLDLMDAAGESDQIIAMDVPLSPSKKDIGLHQYQKEEIPCNPGTVKKQAKDIEDKIIKTSGKSDRLSGELPVLYLPSSAPGSPQGSCEMLADERNNSHQETEMENTDVKEVDATDGDMESSLEADKKDDTQPEMANGDQVFRQEEKSDYFSHEVIVQEPHDKRPTSIYDTEDIDWEPGMVQRTKEELMAKARRPSIESLDLEHKLIQRSSSLRSERKLKSKNRNSERRKTCQPILYSPSPSPERDASLQLDPAFLRPNEERRAKSEEPLSPKTDPDQTAEEVRVMKIGLEEVPLPQGLVKRHTQDYEDLCIEVDSKSKEEKTTETGDMDTLPQPADHSDSPAEPAAFTCSAEENVASDLTEAQLDNPPDTTFTQLEDGLEIPSGTVKEQTRQLETKYGGKDEEHSCCKEEKPDQKRESVCMDTPEDQETKRRRVEQEKTSKIKEKKSNTKEETETLNCEPTLQNIDKVDSCNSCKGKEGTDNSDTQARDKKSPSLSPTTKRKSQQLAQEEEFAPKFRFKMSRDTLRLIREAGKKFTEASTDGKVTDGCDHSPGEGIVRRMAREVEGRWGKVKVPVRIFLYEPQKDELDKDNKKVVTQECSNPSSDKVTETASEHVNVESLPEDDEKQKKNECSQNDESKEEGATCETLGKSVCDESSQDQEELTTVKDLVGKFEGTEEESENGKAKLRRSKSSTDDMSKKETESLPKRYSLQSLPKLDQSEAQTEKKGHSRSISHGDRYAVLGRPSFKISPEREPDPTSCPKKVRKPHGKTHPLSKLTPEGRSKNPFYNTM